MYPCGTSKPLNTLGKFEAPERKVTAEFIITGSEDRYVMGRKTALGLDTVTLGPWVNAVSTGYGQYGLRVYWADYAKRA